MSDHITINGGTVIKDSSLIGATFVTNNNFAHTSAETPQTARPITEIEEAEEVTEPAEENAEEPPAETVEDKIRRAIRTMREEKTLKRAYDYLWVMLVMNQTAGLPNFTSAHSFLTYLRQHAGIHDGLPCESSLHKKWEETHGTHPFWKFTDTKDTRETIRRNNVGNRFLSLIRKNT